MADAIDTSRQPLRILIVEDSAEDAVLMLSALEQEGYQVLSERVQTAEEMKLALDKGGWDAVLSDYDLPSFSAPAALGLLQSTGQDLPFIIISGTVGEEIAVAALKAGAHDFLLKGRLARLAPALQRSLGEVSQRRERARLEEELRQAQKMEVIGRLAGGIAHDFNNILTTITGYSEMLLQQIGTDKPISGDLAEIRNAAGRAAQLTRQLLAFSRQQVLRVDDVDVNKSVLGIRGMLQRLIGEDVVIQLRLSDPLVPMRADPVQLEQILMNVAANARDAMPEGGRFTIETSRVTADTVRALTGLSTTADSYVCLTLADTGVGMDAETRDRLFEPFFTTKGPGKGTGLGLATVYGIVKQLDGHVWVSSELGSGTIFSFFFPASEIVSAVSDEPEKAIAPSPLAADREWLLVVEDDPAVRTLVTRTLTRHGYHVLEASSAAEGLTLAGEYGARIRLLVCDVVMPVMRGPEMVRKIREGRPDIPVLFMSGHTGRPMSPSGALDASDHLLEKPFTANSLLQAVRDLLDSH